MDESERIKRLQFYYSNHGVLPSYSTIGLLVGYKSKSSVYEFIERLKSSNRISLTPENKIKPGVGFWDSLNNKVIGGMGS